MDAFYERLAVRAATIDELLSDDFEPLPGQKGDADLAARRLAAWCRACASGDWSLFDRRLDRDGLAIGQVLARFATVRRNASAAPPAWIEDAIWIEAALQDPAAMPRSSVAPDQSRSLCVRSSFSRRWSRKPRRGFGRVSMRGSCDNLNESARASLRLSLLRELSSLGAAALYERFAKARNAGSPHAMQRLRRSITAARSTIASSPICKPAASGACSKTSRCCCG